MKWNGAINKIVCTVLITFIFATHIFLSPGLISKKPVKAFAAAQINIGDYMELGTYFGEPILWRCVDQDSNGPLMLSDRILCLKPFDAAGKHKYPDGTSQFDITAQRERDSITKQYIYLNRNSAGSNLWEPSSLRSWLNSEASAGDVNWIGGSVPTQMNVYNRSNDYGNEAGFLSSRNFNSSELDCILPVSQKSTLNALDADKLGEGGFEIYSLPNVSTKVDELQYNFANVTYSNVEDNMFCLDTEQITTVYNNGDTLGYDYYIGKPTQTAAQKSEYKARNTLDKNHFWETWTRTPLGESRYAYKTIICDPAGSFYGAKGCKYGSIGVRPAFYLNTNTATLDAGSGTLYSPYINTSEIQITPNPTSQPNTTEAPIVTVAPATTYAPQATNSGGGITLSNNNGLTMILIISGVVILILLGSLLFVLIFTGKKRKAKGGWTPPAGGWTPPAGAGTPPAGAGTPAMYGAAPSYAVPPRPVAPPSPAVPPNPVAPPSRAVPPSPVAPPSRAVPPLPDLSPAPDPLEKTYSIFSSEDSTKICSNCNSILSSDTKFCTKCGAVLRD